MPFDQVLAARPTNTPPEAPVEFDLLIGVFALGVGLATLVLRFVNPSKLRKLQAMKQYFGDQKGTLIHVTAYTVMPLLFGAFLVWKTLAEP